MSDPFSLVILGVTGNLARIKLLPALYDLMAKKILPEGVVIIGAGRKKFKDEEFRGYVREVLHEKNRHHGHRIDGQVAAKLLAAIRYVAGDFDRAEFYQRLGRMIGKQNRIFYLATYPKLYKVIFEHLKGSGLTREGQGWVRLMIEKPIGHDLASAKRLNRLLSSYFDEEQVYRLDHYLGREQLQNILTFRFGNSIIEPVMNHKYIDHIQITAAEDFGIGKRGGYYDSVGALADVGQNHLLQMLAFSVMEIPEAFNHQAVAARRMEVFRQLIPYPEQVVFGQYEGYHREGRITADSTTNTFFALKTELDNERWRGVPIYIRAGKKLKQTATEVSMVFRKPTEQLFDCLEIDCEAESNVLIFRIQPNEGIVLRIMAKTPGQMVTLTPEYMQLCYRQLAKRLPDPYENLLASVLDGDRVFFNSAEEVEAQWRFIDPLDAVVNKPPVYSAGSWGPPAADELIRGDGREWLQPSMQFCQI